MPEYASALDEILLQPNTADNLAVEKYSLTCPLLPRTFSPSTLFPKQFTCHLKTLYFSPFQAPATDLPAFGIIAFQLLPSKAGRLVAFLILARAERRRWLVLGEFAKYAFFWPDKEKSCF